MAKNVYACLLGEWVNLNADSEATIGINGQTAATWYEENAELWSPKERTQYDTYYQLDYVWVHYKNKSYRIHPSLIQIVEE